MWCGSGERAASSQAALYSVRATGACRAPLTADYAPLVPCRQPQLTPWVNHVRVGSYASVTWCTLLYLLQAFELGYGDTDFSTAHTVPHQRTVLTNVMW